GFGLEQLLKIYKRAFAVEQGEQFFPGHSHIVHSFSVAAPSRRPSSDCRGGGEMCFQGKKRRLRAFLPEGHFRKFRNTSYCIMTRPTIQAVPCPWRCTSGRFA